MSNSSIWPIYRTLSGATTQSHRGPESDGNKRALHIPQSSSITGVSPSDCLVSYPGHSLDVRGSAEVQLVYSTAKTRQVRILLQRWFRCRARLILFEYCSPDLLLLLGASHVKFLQPSGDSSVIKYAFIFRITNVFSCVACIIAQFELVNFKFTHRTKFRVHFKQLSDHMQSEAMHNVFVHQLPRYLQSQNVSNQPHLDLLLGSPDIHAAQ